MEIWKILQQINQSDGNDQNTPAVTYIGMGRHLVLWEEGNGGPIAPQSGTDIVGQIFDALGNPIGSEMRFNQSFSAGGQRDPAVAPRKDGGFIVVYEDSGLDAIRFEMYDVDGNQIATPTNTVADEAQSLHNPSVAMNADGTYLVVYERDFGGGNVDIVGKIVDTNGNVGPQIIIHDELNPSRDPNVTALSNGDFVVTWEDADNNIMSSDFDIELKIVTPTGGLGSKINVTNDAVGQSDPKVAGLKDGGFVVAYEQANATQDVYAAIYNNDGSLRVAPFLVHTDTSGAQEDPVVAGLHDGGFVVAWNDETLDVVFAQRYDKDGNKIGDRLDAGSFGDTDNLAIAVLEDGRVFIGYEQTSGDDDVWGTIFDPRGSKIKGTKNDDILTAFANGGTVKGKKGDDYILGSDRGDKLIGGKGNDWIAGGLGDDDVKGNKGKDCFVFNTELSKTNNVDTIRDFKNKGKDKIYLLDDIFGAIGDKLNKKELEFGKNADDGNDYIIVKEGKNKTKIYYDADADGNGKKILFAKVDDDVNLKHKDFKILDDFVI